MNLEGSASVVKVLMAALWVMFFIGRLQKLRVKSRYRAQMELVSALVEEQMVDDCVLPVDHSKRFTSSVVNTL